MALKGLCFFLEGFSLKEKNEIKGKIEENGGALQLVLSKKVSRDLIKMIEQGNSRRCPSYSRITI